MQMFNKKKIKSSLKSWIPSQSQVEYFINVSQASLKSQNLQLESDSSQVMWLKSPTTEHLQWKQVRRIP